MKKSSWDAQVREGQWSPHAEAGAVQAGAHSTVPACLGAGLALQLPPVSTS